MTTTDKSFLVSELPEAPENLQIKEALEEVLAQAASKGIILYLTGGIAASTYGGIIRPLSLDLDFIIPEDDKSHVVSSFDVNFVYFGEKKLFKSVKAVGKTSNGVDLDFIAEQNIVPDEKAPEQKITLRLSKKIKQHSQEREFLGVPVQVLPAEIIVLSKLFAGRGIDLGKYDYVDSRAIIEAGEVDPQLFKGFIEELSGGRQEILDLMKNRLRLALNVLRQDPLSSSEFTEKINTLLAVIDAETVGSHVQDTHEAINKTT